VGRTSWFTASNAYVHIMCDFSREGEQEWENLFGAALVGACVVVVPHSL
jgi:hypothetical protein